MIVGWNLCWKMGPRQFFSVPYSIRQTLALLLVFAISVFMSDVKNSTVNSLQFLKFTNVLINLTKYKGLEFLKAIFCMLHQRIVNNVRLVFLNFSLKQQFKIKEQAVLIIFS